MAAARVWARGGRGRRWEVDEEVRRDLEAFGGAIPEAAAAGAEGYYPVWPENWDRLETFLALQTQWRRDVLAGMGGVTMIWRGLDYTAVAAALGLMGRGTDAALFSDLRAMEAAALTELARCP